MMYIWAIALCLLAPAAWAKPPAPLPLVSLLEFRGDAMVVFQSANQYAFTGALSWAPKFRLYEQYYLRLSAGAFPLRNSNSTNQTFWVMDVQGFVGLPVDEGVIEIGGGMQNWMGGNGGLCPVIGGNIIAPLTDFHLGPLDHLYFGYGAYLGSPMTSHEFRMGLGVKF